MRKILEFLWDFCWHDYKSTKNYRPVYWKNEHPDEYLYTEYRYKCNKCDKIVWRKG
jgi:hypothetical protein